METTSRSVPLYLDSEHRIRLNVAMYKVVSKSFRTESIIQRVTGTLSLGVKRPRREVDHSPPSSAEVKK